MLNITLVQTDSFLESRSDLFQCICRHFRVFWQFQLCTFASSRQSYRSARSADDVALSANYLAVITLPGLCVTRVLQRIVNRNCVNKTHGVSLGGFLGGVGGRVRGGSTYSTSPFSILRYFCVHETIHVSDIHCCYLIVIVFSLLLLSNCYNVVTDLLKFPEAIRIMSHGSLRVTGDKSD